MTDTTDSPVHTPESDRAYWIARIDQMNADRDHNLAKAAQAEKESRYYPFVAIISGAGFMVLAAAIGTYLANLALHR